MDEYILDLIGADLYCGLHNIDSDVFPPNVKCEYVSNRNNPEFSPFLVEGVSVKKIKTSLERYIRYGISDYIVERLKLKFRRSDHGIRVSRSWIIVYFIVVTSIVIIVLYLIVYSIRVNYAWLSGYT